MTKPLSFFIYFVLFISINVSSQPLESIFSSRGAIFAAGEIYDQQIYMAPNSDTLLLTNYEPWEEIFLIKLSLDEQFILVWHKSNKERARKLSIIELDTFRSVKTIYPGVGGSFIWTKSNNIIQRWGCGSPCACFRIYDLEFNILGKGCETGFREFVEEEIIISLPILTMQSGEIKIWSLTSGNQISTVSPNPDLRDHYFSYATMIRDTLSVELRSAISDSLRIVVVPISNQ